MRKKVRTAAKQGGPAPSNPLPGLFLLALLLWAALLLIRRAEAPPAEPTPPAPAEATVPAPPAPRARTLPATEGPPRAAIIIDDFGYRPGDLEELEDFFPVTVAVLPNLPHSRLIADRAREMGYEVILHLPMAPRGGVRAEPGSIDPGMSGGEIRARIESALDSVGPVPGANNHMGSLATSRPDLMEKVLEEFARRRLFFVDSVTSPDSVAAETAWRLNVPSAARDVFLDTIAEPGHIRQQVAQLAAIARRRGQAVAIGHPYPETFAVLREELPLLVEEGVKLVPVSHLVR